jgi:hypothetical protein
MSENLLQDMCSLRNPGTLVRDVDATLLTKCIPAHLRYACLYWVKHVKSSATASTLEAPIIKYLQRHFLNWLETLSLLKALADGVEILSLLESLVVSLLPM